MTSSDKLIKLYETQETASEVIEGSGINATFEEACAIVEQSLRDAEKAALEVAEGYEEGFNALPENFQQTGPGEAIQEKIDACINWGNELESVADEIHGDVEELVKEFNEKRKADEEEGGEDEPMHCSPDLKKSKVWMQEEEVEFENIKEKAIAAIESLEL